MVTPVALRFPSTGSRPEEDAVQEEDQLSWVREGPILHLRRGGEGALRLRTGRGVFKPTAASHVCAATVSALAESGFLMGCGIDWGCGSGLLALVAAQSPHVTRVVGLDLEPANVQGSVENAALNGLSEKVQVHLADSFELLDGTVLELADFILANAPASPFDDGFALRRRIVAEAPQRLRAGGHVVLQAMSYYGPQRVRQAVEKVPGMRYRGLCSSSGWVPVAVWRQREAGCLAGGTMFTQLQDFAEEERRGGLRYHCHPRQTPALPAEQLDVEVFDPPREALDGDGDTYSATETLAMLQEGQMDEVLCRWQCHLCQWMPSTK